MAMNATSKPSYVEMVTKACESTGGKFISRPQIKKFLEEHFGVEFNASSKNALKNALGKFERKKDSYRVSKDMKSTVMSQAKKQAAKEKLAAKKVQEKAKKEAMKAKLAAKKLATKEKLAAKKATLVAKKQAAKEKLAAKKAASKAKKASKKKPAAKKSKKPVKKASKKTSKK
jgi:colicin import membrane protein